MLLGVSSYAFGWAVGVAGLMPSKPMTEADLILFARGQGLRLVQFGDHIPLHTFDEARLARLRDLARQNGAVVEMEIGARGLRESHLARYIALAKALDARLVRFVIDEGSYEPAETDVTALLKASIPLLQEAGVTLGIENHDRFSARTLRRMIETVGSPRVGICLDTANSLGAGEGLEHVLEQLGPVTVNLHLKDYSITRVPHAMGFVIEGRPAGEGRLDVPALRDAIARHGRCRTAVLETWTPPEPLLAATIAKERRWTEAGLAYLKPLFGSA